MGQITQIFIHYGKHAMSEITACFPGKQIRQARTRDDLFDMVMTEDKTAVVLLGFNEGRGVDLAMEIKRCQRGSPRARFLLLAENNAAMRWLARNGLKCCSLPLAPKAAIEEDSVALHENAEGSEPCLSM